MTEEWPPAWQKAVDEALACGGRGDVAGALAVLEALPTGSDIHAACYWLGLDEIPDYRGAKKVPHPYDPSGETIPPYLDYKIHRPANPQDRKCMLAWVRHWVPIAIERHLKRKGGAEKVAAPVQAEAQPAKPVQLDLFGRAA
jgi:hypothetical protein